MRPMLREAPERICAFCPSLCRSACPVEQASGREALTPKAKMRTALELREGRIDATPKTVETLWGCSACGACESACLHRTPVGETLYAARAWAVRHGVQPLAVRETRADVDRFVHSSDLQALDPQSYHEVRNGRLRARVAVLIDRQMLGSPLASAAFLAARSVNHGAKIPAFWHPTEPQALVSGRALREAGEHEAYLRHLAKLGQALAGCDSWWVVEPSDLEDYEAAAARLESRPVVRSLIEVLAESEIAPRKRYRSVVLQRSCAVWHRPALADAMAALAHRLSDDVRTPPDDLPHAGCCGGRGLMGAVLPDVAAEMASGRSHELAETKAEAAVTFSLACHVMLPGTLHGLIPFAPDW
jgi:Fe-S oxidoreductase